MASRTKLTASDVSKWIDNDESLYLWWKRSRQSKRAFIKENGKELVRLIRAVLDRPPQR